MYLFAKDASETTANNVRSHKKSPVVETSMTPGACWCSAGQTQQWPTELTGRCYTHWLSIHRSSPRAPCGETPRSKWNVPRKPFELRCRVGRLSAGNSTSTGTHTAFHMELLLHPASAFSFHSFFQTDTNRRWDHTSSSCRGEIPEAKDREEEENMSEGEAPRLSQDSNSEAAALVREECPLCERLWPGNFLHPVFIAWSKRHHCSLSSNSTAKGPRPVQITQILW